MPSYNPTKLKLTLKLAFTRLGQLEKKYENAGARMRKEVAEYMKKGKIDMARIQVEQLVRDDFYREALEQLKMFCMLVHTRFGLIENKKTCDLGILQAVATILWARPRVESEVPEFKMISQQLSSRFGKEFVEACLNNRDGSVHDLVKKRLELITPAPYIVEGYLSTIAEKYDIPFQPQIFDSAPLVDMTEPMKPSGGPGPYGGGPEPPFNPFPSPPGHDLPQPPGDYPPGNYPPSGPPPPGNGGYHDKHHYEVPRPSNDPDLAFPPVPGGSPAYPPNAPNPANPGVFDPLADLPDLPADFPDVPPRGAPQEQYPPSQQQQEPEPDNVPSFDELSARFAALKRDD